MILIEISTEVDNECQCLNNKRRLAIVRNCLDSAQKTSNTENSESNVLLMIYPTL